MMRWRRFVTAGRILAVLWAGAANLPGVAAANMTSTGVAPTGVAPTGVAPTGAASTGIAPTGIAPTGVAPTGATPIDELHAFLAHTVSMRGDFTQRNPPTGGGQSPAKRLAAISVTQGTFAFQRPGKFRWVVQRPYAQLIVSDGRTLFLYDPDLAQVTKKTLAGALPASPASILFGSNDFERDFDVRNDGTEQGVAWILALPRKKDSPFERIRIGFRNAVPVAMRLVDSFGRTTQLSFDHIQRNPVLDPAQFRFVPPAGVDVLDAR